MKNIIKQIVTNILNLSIMGEGRGVGLLLILLMMAMSPMKMWAVAISSTGTEDIVTTHSEKPYTYKYQSGVVSLYFSSEAGDKDGGEVYTAYPLIVSVPYGYLITKVELTRGYEDFTALSASPSGTIGISSDGNTATIEGLSCHLVSIKAENLYVSRVKVTYAASNHTLTAHPTTAATCTTDGNTAYWSCSCGKYYSDEAGTMAIAENSWVIPAQGHKDEDDDFVCDVCGNVTQAPVQVTAENYAALGLTADYVGYYSISKPGHLVWFRDQVNGEGGVDPQTGLCAKLMADIDLSTVCHAANAETGATMLSWDPIGSKSDYLGTFDGNSKAITGLYVNGEVRCGLFAAIGNGSKVKNLTVEGEVTGPNAAIIISQSYGNVEITNCVSKGTLNGYYGNDAGVLGIGYSDGAIVTYCTNYATITSTGSNVAGVVGCNPLKVEHCVNHGAVTGDGNVGGVVGTISTSTNPVADCANYGTVTNNGSSSAIGGVIGLGFSATHCSNYGNVTATSATNVGGISGDIRSGYSYGFKDCLNRGDIKGLKNVGGLVGLLEADNNANSYSTGKVESSSPYGGLLIGCYSNGSSAALSNVYYIKGATVKANGTEIANRIQGDGYPIGASQNVGKSEAEFASGEVCYLLNGSRSAGTTENPLVWYQAIGLDAYPTFEPNQYAIVKYDATDGYYNDIENFASIEITDATEYTANSKRKADEFIYTRTFTGTNWTTWYVPFELTLTDDICKKYEFSRINNVRQYDDNNDGKADRTVVESFRMKSGKTLKANYPYLVRARYDASKEMTLNLQNVTLAEAEENSIDCQSLDYKYTFTGTYAGMDYGNVASTEYTLCDNTADNWERYHALNAQRCYMTVTTLNGASALTGRIELNVLGEDNYVIPGDLNADGNITIADLTLLIQLLNQGGTITNKAADVNKDGSVTVDDVEKLRDKVLGVKETPVHEYVDLGLPSHTLWATCNIGAESPEESGLYFAWGETTGYEVGHTFSWTNYKWMTSGMSDWEGINKYTFADNQTDVIWYNDGSFIGDGKTSLDPEDDAATANWGNDWQMPTPDQFDELISSKYTSTEWVEINGVNGYKITSKIEGYTDIYIFLPAAGRLDTSGILGSSENAVGCFWTNQLDSEFSDYAIYLNFYQEQTSPSTNGHSRQWGFSVRAVRK